jgi:hypothetical protein
VTPARREWCDRPGSGDAPQPGYEGDACEAFFAGLDERFETAWTEERTAAVANRDRADLAGLDLRRALADSVSLVGANLRGARLEGADLGWARLERAYLGWARLERAYLRYADFRKSNWAGADFRGAQALTQARLDQLIGNEDTLLPDGPSDTGAPFHVWCCWETPPVGFDALVARVAERTGGDPDSIRAEFLCGPDNPRRKTGTPWPLDEPRPEGHPLGPD